MVKTTKVTKKEVPSSIFIAKEQSKVIDITIEGDEIEVLKEILAIAIAGNAPSKVKALVGKIRQQL